MAKEYEDERNNEVIGVFFYYICILINSLTKKMEWCVFSLLLVLWPIRGSPRLRQQNQAFISDHNGELKPLLQKGRAFEDTQQGELVNRADRDSGKFS